MWGCCAGTRRVQSHHLQPSLLLQVPQAAKWGRAAAQVSIPAHTELAGRAVLSSRSRQCMPEDDVKIKSCKYRRCFQADCRQVPTTCLIWLVVEILIVLKTEIEVLLTPEVPGSNGQSLLLVGLRAGWPWWCLNMVTSPRDRAAAFGSG